MNALQSASQASLRYFRESYIEMKNVVWPSRKQTIVHTIMVVVFSVLIAAFLSSLDVIFTKLLEMTLIK